MTVFGIDASLLAYVLASVFGLAVFVWLLPLQRAREMEPATAGTSTPMAAEPGARLERTRPEEAHLPRWLRPSVQAARHGIAADVDRDGLLD